MPCDGCGEPFEPGHVVITYGSANTVNGGHMPLRSHIDETCQRAVNAKLTASPT
jgi:hypothetical protein